MKILVTARLSDYKLATHIQGLIDSDHVDEIFLVRRLPLPGLPKIKNVNPSSLIARSVIGFEIWRIFMLRRLIKANEICALVGIQVRLHGFQATLCGVLTRTPVILALIGSDVHIYLSGSWLAPLFRWAVRNASVILVMGPKSRQIVSKTSTRDVPIIEMQVFQDESRFVPRSGSKKWDLIFVGNLIPLKRAHTLLYAIGLARQSLPDIRAAIIGDGPELPRLRKLADSLGLSNAVEFLGYTRCVEKFLQASRIFVLPSDSEGVPSAAIEAMYCGLPAILSDVGDVRSQFLPEENAILVPAGDTAALARAIERFLQDEEFYDQLQKGALAARARHATAWSRRGCQEKWEEVLGIVTAAPPKRELA